MATLVNRCKQIISAENDDFFRNETILYYINKSARNVINYAIKEELRPTVRVGDQTVKGTERSLRALDSLRGIDTTTLATADFSNTGTSYFYGDLTLPADLMQLLHVRYNKTIPLRELNSQKLYLLNHGNLEPTGYEGYFYVKSTASELYLHEDPDGKDVDVFYIKEPTELTSVTTETFTDISDQLENAILYGAAMMMLGQESVKDSEGNVQNIAQIYQQELQSSIF